MSNFRVSLGSMEQTTLYDLEGSMSRLETLQNQLSSGKAITQPSDNPTGTVQAMNYQANLDRSAQYAKNISDGEGWLGQADSTLSDVQTQMQKVQTLVIQAANGSTDANGRSAIADQIDSIRQGCSPTPTPATSAGLCSAGPRDRRTPTTRPPRNGSETPSQSLAPLPQG